MVLPHATRPTCILLDSPQKNVTKFNMKKESYLLGSFCAIGGSFFGSIAGAQINENFEATETEQLVL